jgi:hypothetical protein
MDFPLRTFSSGMVARLAFCAATDENADILLVDEIMSDTFFCPHEKKVKPYTRYRIAKEAGVSWHTINKATKCGDFGYQRKTKVLLTLILKHI